MSVRPDVVHVCTVQNSAIVVISGVQMQAADLHQQHGNAGKGNDGQGRESHRIDYTGQEQGCTI